MALNPSALWSEASPATVTTGVFVSISSLQQELRFDA